MAPSTIFIFHGVGGHPGENWFPWLAKELEAEGHHVIVPAFPSPDHPKLQEWLEHFQQYEAELSENTVLIGHSLGGAFALRLLEHSANSIRAVFLVASVSGVMGNQFDPAMTTFTVPPYNWERIRERARSFHVISSDNDPYIKLSQVQELAHHLGVEVELIPGAGHFNASAGYTTFPQLLEMVRARP